MTEFIDSLEIHGFRCFSKLVIPAFGKVNLITGKNNTGKSSLLEAIRIFVTQGALDTVQSILRYREETNKVIDHDRYYSGIDFGPYRNLFTGFPDFSSGSAKFVITASGRISSITSEFSLSTVWAMRQTDPETGMVGSYESTPDLFGDLAGEPALEKSVDGRSRILPLTVTVHPRRISIARFWSDTPERVRCVYLDPFSSKTTERLGALWDAIALTDIQDEIVKALQLIVPDIQAVSMIGSDDSGPRTAIIRSQQFNSPVPLRTFGDGVNRLFSIILSLCNAKDGVLLIDEFENGLHYSIQPSIWKIIFRLADDLNVQVFATTHSRDCVKAFQEAGIDSPQNGVLIRLTRKDDIVLPTMFRERELEIATQNEIEVR